MNKDQSKHSFMSVPVLGLTSVFVATLLIACGGGSSGSGSSATLSQGPITGFGSVFVNGVRYDDSAASVSFDDDDNQSKNALRLGMMVEIEGDSSSATTGVARSISSSSQLKGRIGNKTTASGATTLTVLGVTVTLKANTVIAGTTVASLAVGDVVEIHGIPTGADSLTATYIEKEDLTDQVRTVGLVQAHDPFAKTFTLHGINIQYDAPSVDRLPVTGLWDGLLVRVKGTMPSTSSTITATKVKGIQTKARDSLHVEVEGVITSYVSLAAFNVGELKIDASKAILERVTPANGVRVEVKGTFVNGTLVASKVQSQDENQAAEIELHGLVSNANSTAKTFKLRNVLVNWNGTAFVAPFTEAGLVEGANIEVKGSIVNGSVKATRIKKED